LKNFSYAAPKLQFIKNYFTFAVHEKVNSSHPFALQNSTDFFAKVWISFFLETLNLAGINKVAQFHQAKLQLFNFD